MAVVSNGLNVHKESQEEADEDGEELDGVVEIGFVADD